MRSARAPIKRTTTSTTSIANGTSATCMDRRPSAGALPPFFANSKDNLMNNRIFTLALLSSVPSLCFGGGGLTVKAVNSLQLARYETLELSAQDLAPLG